MQLRCDIHVTHIFPGVLIASSAFAQKKNKN